MMRSPHSITSVDNAPSPACGAPQRYSTQSSSVNGHCSQSAYAGTAERGKREVGMKVPLPRPTSIPKVTHQRAPHSFRLRWFWPSWK
eukprot:gene10966-biopygen5596